MNAVGLMDGAMTLAGPEAALVVRVVPEPEPFVWIVNANDAALRLLDQTVAKVVYRSLADVLGDQDSVLRVIGECDERDEVPVTIRMVRKGRPVQIDAILTDVTTDPEGLRNYTLVMAPAVDAPLPAGSVQDVIGGGVEVCASIDAKGNVSAVFGTYMTGYTPTFIEGLNMRRLLARAGIDMDYNTLMSVDYNHEGVIYRNYMVVTRGPKGTALFHSRIARLAVVAA